MHSLGAWDFIHCVKKPGSSVPPPLPHSPTWCFLAPVGGSDPAWCAHRALQGTRAAPGWSISCVVAVMGTFVLTFFM